MISWSFQWSNLTTEPPTGNQIRSDGVSKLWVRDLNNDGLDVHTALMAIDPATTIYLQDKNDHTIYVRLVVGAAPVNKPGYVEFPVQGISISGALNNNQAIEAFFIEPDILPPGPESEPGPPRVVNGGPLLELTTAKIHLRVTDTDHDADITLKANQASIVIRDYLDTRNDPAWTPATVPPWVQAAVLLYLGSLYEHRGDEFGPAQDNDDRVWMAITNLLRRSRDPVLA